MMENQENLFADFKIKDNFTEYSSVKSVLIRNGFVQNAGVSVLIPTRLRTDTLMQTLDSLLRQTYTEDFNIIVVDNNPERNDDTEKFIASSDISNLSYYKNEENIGMFGNINRLFELSPTDYTIVVHDDDMLYPTFIKDMYGLMCKYPEIDILFPHKYDWHPEKESFEDVIRKNKAIPCLFKMSLIDFQTDSNNASPTGFICKTKAVLDLGGFDEKAYPSSDYYFNVKACLHKNVYCYTAPLYAYRWAQNTSLKKDIVINWMQLDIPLERWISRHIWYLRPFAFQFNISYSIQRWNLLKSLYPETEESEVEAFIPMHFSSCELVFNKCFMFCFGKLRNLIHKKRSLPIIYI